LLFVFLKPELFFFLPKLENFFELFFFELEDFEFEGFASLELFLLEPFELDSPSDLYLPLALLPLFLYCFLRPLLGLDDSDIC
jgi:hypothetical protein